MNETPREKNLTETAQAKPLWNNVITLVGLFLAAMSLMLLATFVLFSIVVHETNPYVDIIGYLVLPGLLVVSLLIVPFGILFKSWRLRRHDPQMPLAFGLPHINLSDPTQRKVAKFFVLGTFLMLPIVGVSAYQGYHYTDSPQFCGYACHSVMEPQAATYEISPHARVSCAECHIGAGAGWFVKSKLSGTRQIFATMFESYSRPIPPAIHHLRPARETCERCHWPEKFYGAQYTEIPHFAADAENTRRDVHMHIKTGGSDVATGRAEGIHLHMALANRIEYVATDAGLQEIPWVRMTDEGGNKLIYRSDGKPSSDPRPDGLLRRIDCMDCHNRPAHRFPPPQESVNMFLSSGRIDMTLPFIKREAIRVLVQTYPDVPTAEARIGFELTEFYEENYPDLVRTRRASLNQAIDAVRTIYRQSFFPGMKVDWQVYPDNIGHMYFPGCFRCHAGNHVNQFGEAISHDCSVCHTFLNPEITGEGATNLVQGEFIHPYELDQGHAMLRCDQCHSGGIAPSPNCTGCHDTTESFRAGTLAALTRFDIQPEPMFGILECGDCHDMSQPMSLQSLDAACMGCHDDEPEKYEGMLAGWKKDISELWKRAEAQSDPEGRELLRVLRKAGALHNVEAAKKILQSVSTGGATTAVPIGEE
jgi:hypothetical protein